MPVPITQGDMDAVFRVTDELGLHRESVTVPLARRDPGGVRPLGRGVFQITLPETVAVEEWAESHLRAELARHGFEALP